MSKRRRRYKIVMTVERIHEVMEFLQVRLSHINLSSQERRHIEGTLKELKKNFENSNTAYVWISHELVENILQDLLRVFESYDEDRKK